MPDVEAVCRRAARAAVEATGRSLGAAEVAIVLADDGEVQQLNRRYRGQDKPTDVLSFAASDEALAGVGGLPVPLGDVVMALETAAADAAAAGTPLRDHLSHLVVHGMLHLLGYDHLTDADAEVMEGIERAALDGMGIPNPYEHDPH